MIIAESDLKICHLSASKWSRKDISSSTSSAGGSSLAINSGSKLAPFIGFQKKNLFQLAFRVPNSDKIASI